VTSNEARELLANDPDFIYSKRFDFSLKKLLNRYPEGAPTKVIAQSLMMTEDELQELEQSIILKIRQELRVEVDT
jgi:hypothetical protein